MNSNNDTQAWRDDLEQKLQQKEKENSFDLLVSYFDISMAFHGNPHSSHIGINAVDFNALTSWAKDRGWYIETAPECTHPNQQTTPKIRFTKIGYVPTDEQE